ncbi:TIR domain-containing protein [Pseudomonas sp. NPDC087342]|uniref:toll/interleukin-1 receptor domain-containing protein n=1 Tax=Pseudomonas sp. NPDC087342 TaxID=3364437 RepID=UPI0037FDEDC1
MQVFISYSWDSEEHKQWIQQLAEDLTDLIPDLNVEYDQRGMDHRVDRNQYMEAAIFESDAVLVIVTKNYTERANARKGGVGRETAMAAELHWMESSSKSKTRILAIKREADAEIPRYLVASLYFDFTSEDAYLGALVDLKHSIESIGNRSEDQQSISKSASPEGGTNEADSFSFTRTDDLLAGFYKVRMPLWRVQDFSGQRRVKYELWRVDTPHPQLLLVLTQNINIRQTLEDFVSKIRDLPTEVRSFRELTILRPSPGKVGYVGEQLEDLGHSISVTELTFKSYLGRFCVDADSLQLSVPFREPFYIDQTLYRVDGHDPETLGPALVHLNGTVSRADSPPLSLLVASGGAGKTTLLRSLSAAINESKHSRVMLIEADTLKKLPRDQLRRSHVSSLFDLCELHSMALTAAGATPIRVPSNRNVFDLLLISGSLLILIDGIDELLSMMSSSFELVPFVESIKALNAELGQTRVFLAGREDTVGTTVASLRRHGVPIYNLKGFTSDEVAQYVQKRFYRRQKEERQAIVIRIQETLRAVSTAMDDETVLPFFVDALCELEEEAISTGVKLKFEGAIKDRMAEAGYPHNVRAVDLLVFAIIDRERERQDWKPPVVRLVDVLKEFSSVYFGTAQIAEFSVVVETYLAASATSSAVTDIFCKNPLLLVTNEVVAYRYDFLQSYFLGLWLIEKLEDHSISSELFIKHFSRLATGQGAVFEELSRFYVSKPRKEVQNLLTDAYSHFKAIALNVNSDAGAADSARAVCSCLLHLFAATAGKGLNRAEFSTAIFSVVGEETTGERRLTKGLFISGDFPLLHFIDREFWNCKLNGYDSFPKCRFSNTKFYYSTFIAIHAENCSPTMSSEVFDLDSCDLGEMTTSLIINGDNVGALLTLEEIKRFFSYFFVGGGFASKLPDELYQFPKLSMTKEFLGTLLQAGVLLENKSKAQMRYEVNPIFMRPVQKLVNENNVHRQFRELFKDFLGR